jgi:hypothetical protein
MRLSAFTTEFRRPNFQFSTYGIRYLAEVMRNMSRLTAPNILVQHQTDTDGIIRSVRNAK